MTKNKESLFLRNLQSSGEKLQYKRKYDIMQLVLEQL